MARNRLTVNTELTKFVPLIRAKRLTTNDFEARQNRKRLIEELLAAVMYSDIGESSKRGVMCLVHLVAGYTLEEIGRMQARPVGRERARQLCSRGARVLRYRARALGIQPV